MAHADELLAGELGVHAGLVASVRRDNLQEGIHWTRDGTGKVDYTSEGREFAASLLGLEKKEGAPPPAPAAPPEPLSGPQRLRVCGLLPNPLWVAVALPGGGRADVQVRHRASLRPGVLLLCQTLPDGRLECVHPGHASPLPKTPSGTPS